MKLKLSRDNYTFIHELSSEASDQTFSDFLTCPLISGEYIHNLFVKVCSGTLRKLKNIPMI